MPAPSDPERLIADAARRVLSPLGCRRKGRSRLWFDDRRWWVGVIEFQPSALAAGSFLNVGAMWLWNAKDHWSFDEGGRVDAFQAFQDPAQFAQAAERLAAVAAAEVASLRRRFASVDAAAAVLERKDRPSIWDRFHAGAALALAGRPDAARAALEAAGRDGASAPWAQDLKARCRTLAATFVSAEEARRAMRHEIVQARARLGLPPLEGDPDG